MKLVLMGTNSFVVPIFDALSKLHTVQAVFTGEPKPQGRKQVLTKTSVHLWAEEKGFPVFHNTMEYNFSPDMVVVISYGKILRDNVLKSAPCINIHPSMLPKYRGPSPIRTALYNGDKKSAVCIMQIVPELDAGDILMRKDFDISDNDTNETLEAKVSDIATDMLIEYLSCPEKYKPVKQEGEVIYTRKFTSKDEIIDWSRSPVDIHNQIRALGSGRTKINGIEVKILETVIKDGKLEITKIQPSGKKAMDWKSFVNGMHGAELRFSE